MTWALKILKISTLIGSFCAKYVTFHLKKPKGVIFHDTEEWCKIWRKTDLWFRKWLEEFGKLLPKCLKVSKLGLWWDPFIQSTKCMSLKITEELSVITMKNDTKFEEELTCCFKIDISNLPYFWPEHSKVSKICTLMVSFWTKYVMFELKKVEKSDIWWHWRLMQNLKENWLVLYKIAWGVWQIFTG